MNKQNPKHDLLKVEVAQSTKYAGSDWCAEMFDRFDRVQFNKTLGTGVERDARIANSGIQGRAWLSLAEADTTGFLRKVAENQTVRNALANVTSADGLVNLARANGFDVTRESLTASATAAYDRWKADLSATVREFFEKAIQDDALRKQLAASRGPGEIISLAKKSGYEISDGELEAMHLKLNDLQESEASAIYGAFLALQVLRASAAR